MAEETHVTDAAADANGGAAAAANGKAKKSEAEKRKERKQRHKENRKQRRRVCTSHALKFLVAGPCMRLAGTLFWFSCMTCLHAPRRQPGGGSSSDKPSTVRLHACSQHMRASNQHKWHEWPPAAAAGNLVCPWRLFALCRREQQTQQMMSR